MDRRSLMDGSVTPTRDVFGDELEADDFDAGMVADGFRPSGLDRGQDTARRSYSGRHFAGDNAGRRDRSLESLDRRSSVAASMASGRTAHAQEEDGDEPIHTVSAYYSTRPVSPSSTNTYTPTLTARNSIRKARPTENPFTSPDDPQQPTLTFEPDTSIRRSVSSVSSAQFAATGSPRFAAGPSHPYGMYPQGTIQRSPSVNTTTTLRPIQRQSSVRNGPAHPYAMYPQGVDEDMDEDDEEGPHALHNPVPMGFTGLGQSYQRRLGPDGEEQDIIGEDGHIEQLPPYSRYPDEVPEKMPLLEVPTVPTAPTALHSRAPVAGTDPGMDLMHTPLRPQAEPQSMTDASTLTRQSTRSSAALLGADASESVMEKKWKQKSWKDKCKTKICGIPFWGLLLAGIVLVIVVPLLGGILGGLAHDHKEHTSASPSFYDASPIATPVSNAPPTGTFSLSLSTPQEIQNECLTETNQKAAWSCDLGGDASAASISVEIPSGSNQSGAYIYYNSDDLEICYGAQASWMQTVWAPFVTVQDNDYPSAGPAYYFQQFYDKLVVLPENALNYSASDSSGSNKAKRQAIQLDSLWFEEKAVAQPGEKPWFCVWNNTFLEGFIYVQQTAATSYSFSTNSSSASNTITSSPPPPTSSAPAPTTAVSTETVTTTVSGTSSTGTFTGLPAAASSFAAHIDDPLSSYADEKKILQPTPAAVTPGTEDKRRAKRDDDDDPPLGLYPYVVKIEERRLSGNTVNPYCQQYQMLDNGKYNWVTQANGEPIIIELEETDPTWSDYKKAGLADSKRRRVWNNWNPPPPPSSSSSPTQDQHQQRDLTGRGTLERRQEVSGSCHCQWTSGQSSS